MAKKFETFESFLPVWEYYQLHSSTDTIKAFGISQSMLMRTCKRFNLHKDMGLVYAQRDYSLIKSHDYQVWKKEKYFKEHGYLCNLNKPSVIEKAHSDEAKNLRRTHAIETINNKINNGIDVWGLRNEKSRQTKLKLYGDENYNNPDKNYLTNLKNNGGKFNSGRKKYVCDNEVFNSLPELALWKYAKDHNEDIERSPCVFEYEVNGVFHKYFPDFRYNGELIEVKGDHFFEEFGNPNTPLIPIYGEGDELEYARCRAKWECALANGVKFITSSIYNLYISYFKNNYNVEDFLPND